MVDVSITNRQNILPVDRRRIRELVRASAPEEWVNAALSVVLVADEEIRALNARFLKRAQATDVLAFPLDGPDASDRPMVGEVVVSAERAVEEAERREVRPEVELALYVVHGVLHLAGFDDHSPENRRAMRAREAEILARFGWHGVATKNPGP